MEQKEQSEVLLMPHYNAYESFQTKKVKKKNKEP